MKPRMEVSGLRISWAMEAEIFPRPAYRSDKQFAQFV